MFRGFAMFRRPTTAQLILNAYLELEDLSNAVNHPMDLMNADLWAEYCSAHTLRYMETTMRDARKRKGSRR